MSLLSAKRQVTIPKELCDRLHVHPGDDLDFVEYGGRITIIRKQKGASAGALRHLKGDSRYTDDESLQDAVSQRRSPTKRKGSAA